MIERTKPEIEVFVISTARKGSPLCYQSINDIQGLGYVEWNPKDDFFVLTKGPKWEFLKQSEGLSIFTFSAFSGFESVVETFVNEFPETVLIQNQSRRSVFHFGVIGGHERIIRILLENTPDKYKHVARTVDSSYSSPPEMAIEFDDLAIFIAFIDYGVIELTSYFASYFLHLAAKYKAFEIFNFISNEYKGSILLTPSGDNIMHSVMDMSNVKLHEYKKDDLKPFIAKFIKYVDTPNYYGIKPTATLDAKELLDSAVKNAIENFSEVIKEHQNKKFKRLRLHVEPKTIIYGTTFLEITDIELIVLPAPSVKLFKLHLGNNPSLFAHAHSFNKGLPLMFFAIIQNDFEGYKQLIDLNPNYLDFQCHVGNVFHVAVMQFHESTFESLFQTYGHDYAYLWREAHNRDGFSAFHYAILSENIKALKIMFDSKLISHKDRDDYSHTPLLFAIHNRKLLVLDYFLSKRDEIVEIIDWYYENGINAFAASLVIGLPPKYILSIASMCIDCVLLCNVFYIFHDFSPQTIQVLNYVVRKIPDLEKRILNLYGKTISKDKPFKKESLELDISSKEYQSFSSEIPDFVMLSEYQKNIFIRLYALGELANETGNSKSRKKKKKKAKANTSDENSNSEASDEPLSISLSQLVIETTPSLFIEATTDILTTPTLFVPEVYPTVIPVEHELESESKIESDQSTTDHWSLKRKDDQDENVLDQLFRWRAVMEEHAFFEVLFARGKQRKTHQLPRVAKDKEFDEILRDVSTTAKPQESKKNIWSKPSYFFEFENDDLVFNLEGIHPLQSSDFTTEDTSQVPSVMQNTLFYENSVPVPPQPRYYAFPRLVTTRTALHPQNLNLLKQTLQNFAMLLNANFNDAFMVQHLSSTIRNLPPAMKVNNLGVVMSEIWEAIDSFVNPERIYSFAIEYLNTMPFLSKRIQMIAYFRKLENYYSIRGERIKADLYKNLSQLT